MVENSKRITTTYPFYRIMCSKYGFYIIISEGIIDLHHILLYLYKCHVADVLSWWAYVMTADNYVSRGSPLIGTARQNLPAGELGLEEPRGLRGRGRFWIYWETRLWTRSTKWVYTNSILEKLWEYDKHNQYFQPFIQIPTCSSQTTTKQITPHQKSSMNQCIFSSLSYFIACMQGCHSIHQMANLTNVAKMEFDPTPTYRPITPRYQIRFSSFKIWWHDNMLT